MSRTHLFIPILLFTVAVHGQKIDTIQLDNGNIVTGEIKRLELGILYYSTDAMSTVQVKWEEVIRIKSPRFFEIWMDGGFRYYGSFGWEEESGSTSLILTNGSKKIPISDITNVYPIKKTFFNRLEGSLSIGYNYTKATKNTQFNLNGFTRYKGMKNTVELSFNSIISRTTDTISSKNQSALLSYKRSIGGPWYAGTLTAIEQNTELGIQRRVSLSAGISRDLLRDLYNLFESTAGLSINREWTTSADTVQNNAEGFISLVYQRFKHTSPKMSISVHGYLFPSLSDPGRVRVNTSVDANVEVISDLFIGLSFYYSLDNKPLTSNASKQDWGIVTSLGYSFP